LIKHLLFLFLAVSLILNAQEKPKPVLIEHNSVITNSGQIEIISYRIPYKNLLFTKNGENYNSSFTITFEFYQEEEFVKREILNANLSVDDYDKTLSKDHAYQDFFTSELSPGEYSLRSILSLGSTELEYKIPDHIVKVDSIQNTGIIGPIIINNIKDTNNDFELTNYGNSIPFSPNRFNILMGFNYELDTLKMAITQNDQNVFSGSFLPMTDGNLTVAKENEDIKIEVSDSSDFKYFIISGFSHLLYEGQFELMFTLNGNEKKYNLKTAWIDKPKVLNNPEYSIKLLSYIESENIVGELLSSDEENYYQNLIEYWNSNYPADGMKFNYAMEEYYSRAEHAVDNYSSLNAFDGAERDRGKIYILYGPPTSIDRNYTEMNEILEIWHYKNLGRKFVFKDVKGTGKFDLTD
jgi:GWxTD domain-containing protein